MKSKQSRDPPSAMMNQVGNHVTYVENIMEMALRVYVGLVIDFLKNLYHLQDPKNPTIGNKSSG